MNEILAWIGGVTHAERLEDELARWQYVSQGLPVVTGLVLAIMLANALRSGGTDWIWTAVAFLVLILVWSVTAASLVSRLMKKEKHRLSSYVSQHETLIKRAQSAVGED